MNTLKDAINFIKSEEYLNYVIKTNKWCYHGTDVFLYFEMEDFVIEYANTIERKKIIVSYIKKRLKEIINEIEKEQDKYLYRAIYSEKKLSATGFFGHHWSSKKETNICFESKNEDEYLLFINRDSAPVNWKETLMARMDYIHGKRESEFFLDKKIITLLKIEKI